MKQKDIAVLIIVAFIAAVFSLLLTQALPTFKTNNKLKAETVEPIKAQFNEPDKSVFNSNAVNPTQLIQIGDTGNSRPF